MIGIKGKKMVPWHNLIPRMFTNQTGEPRPGQRQTVFEVLAFGLLVTCANIALVNQRFGFGRSSGKNSFGPRDVFLIVLILIPLVLPWKEFLAVIRGRALPIVLLAGLSVAIANLFRGFLLGRDTFNLLAELAPFIAWCLPLTVALNVRTEASLRRLWGMVCWIGVLEAAGVIAEIVFRVPIVTGVSYSDLSDGMGDARSTPSGWAIMIFAASGLLVTLLGGRTITTAKRISCSVGLAIVIMGSLLTQSRTILVGLWFAFGAITLFGKIGKRRIIIALVLLSSPLWILIAGKAGDVLVGQGYSDGFSKRYSVLCSVGASAKYAHQDGRTMEVESGLETWDSWILFGTGLAGSYNDPSGESKDTGQSAHNSLLYFATRFGVLGIILFGALIFVTIRASLVALKSGYSLGGVGCGAGAGVIGISACTMFAGVMTSTYITPIVALGWGIVWAHTNIANRSQTYFSGRGPQRTFVADTCRASRD